MHPSRWLRGQRDNTIATRIELDSERNRDTGIALLGNPYRIVQGLLPASRVRPLHTEMLAVGQWLFRRIIRFLRVERRGLLSPPLGGPEKH